jgi:hypothetical protein
MASHPDGAARHIRSAGELVREMRLTATSPDFLGEIDALQREIDESA